MTKWEAKIAGIAAGIDRRRWEFECSQQEDANTFVFDRNGGGHMILFPNTWHAGAGIGLVSHVSINFAPTEVVAKRALEAALRELAGRKR